MDPGGLQGTAPTTLRLSRVLYSTILPFWVLWSDGGILGVRLVQDSRFWSIFVPK
jgi:hypothetical protein